jgi:hypothetical protein
MLTKERARELLAYGATPFLNTDEVCWICEIKPNTLRTWIHKGAIELGPGRQGSGVPVHYSFQDLLVIMAVAQLSSVFFPSSRASEPACLALDLAVTQLAYMGGAESEEAAERHRYLSYGSGTKPPYRWEVGSSPKDSVWIVIDCRDLVIKTATRLKLAKFHVSKK